MDVMLIVSPGKTIPATLECPVLHSRWVREVKKNCFWFRELKERRKGEGTCLNVSFDILCEVFFAEVTPTQFGNDFFRIVFHLTILSDELEEFGTKFCQIKNNFFGATVPRNGNLIFK